MGHGVIMRTNYLRLKNIIKNNFKEVSIGDARFKGFVVIADEGCDTEERVRIELTEYNGTFNSHVGIHLILTSDIEHDLIDAVQSAFKDLLPTIYVYQKAKPNPERAKRLRASIQGWIDSIRKRKSHWCYGSYALNKVYDLETTLDSMSEDQLHAVLMLMSANFSNASQCSRDWRARMDKDDEQYAAGDKDWCAKAVSND